MYIPKERLKGKIAAITASTQGIGFAIAKQMALEGAHVIISSRKQANVDVALEKLKAEGLEATGVVCHVANADHRKNLLDAANALGGLDILVSNAALNAGKSSVIDCTEAAWDKIFEVNVKAAFLLTKESVPLLKRRGGGNIVYISTIGSFYGKNDSSDFPEGKNPFGAYMVSKTALNGLTKMMAADLRGENIRVNCVAPGLIQTKFLDSAAPPAVMRAFAMPIIPLKRLGTVDDIAGVVTFLVSADANYITGEIIVAAGGIHSRL